MHEVSLSAIVEERRSQPQQLVEVLQDVQEQFRGIFPARP